MLFTVRNHSGSTSDELQTRTLVLRRGTGKEVCEKL